MRTKGREKNKCSGLRKYIGTRGRISKDNAFFCDKGGIGVRKREDRCGEWSANSQHEMEERYTKMPGNERIKLMLIIAGRGGGRVAG
jgi:hypothetical protein